MARRPAVLSFLAAASTNRSRFLCSALLTDFIDSLNSGTIPPTTRPVTNAAATAATAADGYEQRHVEAYDDALARKTLESGLTRFAATAQPVDLARAGADRTLPAPDASVVTESESSGCVSGRSQHRVCRRGRNEARSTATASELVKEI